jgi:hypothetical protein
MCFFVMITYYCLDETCCIVSSKGKESPPTTLFKVAVQNQASDRDPPTRPSLSSSDVSVSLGSSSSTLRHPVPA